MNTTVSTAPFYIYAHLLNISVNHTLCFDFYTHNFIHQSMADTKYRYVLEKTKIYNIQTNKNKQMLNNLNYCKLENEIVTVCLTYSVHVPQCFDRQHNMLSDLT